MNIVYYQGLYYGPVLNDINDTTIPDALDQLDTRPKIDDVICHNLDGAMLKDALFIIDNIRDNKMKIKWSSINVWSVQYKRRHVCDLKIANGSLNIGPVNDVLATRVKNMSYTRENINWLIDALRSPVTSTQEVYAMQH